jgi:hypothetical protein
MKRRFKVEDHVGKVEVEGGKYSWHNTVTDEYGEGRTCKLHLTMKKSRGTLLLDQEELSELISTLIDIHEYVERKPFTVLGKFEEPVVKKITVKDYPSTFSFTIDDDLPEFDEEEEYCEVRTEILHEMMHCMQIPSPCHLYEDYVVQVVEITEEGETWYLGS